MKPLERESASSLDWGYNQQLPQEGGRRTQLFSLPAQSRAGGGLLAGSCWGLSTGSHPDHTQLSRDNHGLSPNVPKAPLQPEQTPS